MKNKKRNLWVVGELPKAVFDFETAEAEASAQYEEMKKSDPEKALKFWQDYVNQGNATKFKKETLPALSKALEGKEIPGEVAEGLPITLEKNFTLNANREASTTGVFTAGASNETMVMNYYPVAFDADDNAIDVGRNIGFIDYPIKEGKKFSIGYYISVKAENAAKWARLAKIVIMDKTSDAYKQAARDKDRDGEWLVTWIRTALIGNLKIRRTVKYLLGRLQGCR